MSNNEIIPQYNVSRQNYSPEEKILLSEIRENLVDLAISTGENFQPNEEKLLGDIRNFLFMRLSDEKHNRLRRNRFIDSG